ncbi:MAG: tetratricopeptide repeat protein, partial [Candidatus Omnitrophota bacterium]|nr:tetratricopeptide repeat protein [Candidatus Omnitrophota bacterium]
ALEKAGSYNLAIAHFKKALTEEDSEMNAEIQYNIAQCVEANGDPKASIEEYLKVAYLYPSSRFWGIKSEFRCAQIFEKNNETEKAKKIYERLVNEPVEEGKYAKDRLAWFGGQGR